MAQTFPFAPPPPPRLGPQWSTGIVIVAVLFLLAVLAFYYSVR